MFEFEQFRVIISLILFLLYIEVSSVWVEALLGGAGERSDQFL